MNRRDFLGGAAAAATAGSTLRAADAKKPNIVVILSDDLGYGSLNCYGADKKLIRTPNIDRIAAEGHATVHLNLLPSHSPEAVLTETRRARGPRSLSTHLKSRLGIQGLKMALLHELLTPEQRLDPVALAQALQALPITLVSPRPMDEAISTAGGVRFEAVDEHLMLKAMPGVFCAGEMLDWEAPTGGYLLTASLATGKRAALGIHRNLNEGVELTSR